jgi:hypothetical protein
VNKYDTLVLGAFGCGVFKNNSLDVAIIFRQHLESKEFKNSFKRIVFAILNAEMCQVFAGTNLDFLFTLPRDSIFHEIKQIYKVLTT